MSGNKSHLFMFTSVFQLFARARENPQTRSNGEPLEPRVVFCFSEHAAFNVSIAQAKLGAQKDSSATKERLDAEDVSASQLRPFGNSPSAAAGIGHTIFLRVSARSRVRSHGSQHISPDCHASCSYMRMLPATFDKLLSLVENSIRRRDTNWRECIPARTRLEITLR